MKIGKIDIFVKQSYIYNCHLCIDDLRKEISIIDRKIEILKKEELYRKIDMLEDRKINLYKKIELEMNDIVDIKN